MRLVAAAVALATTGCPGALPNGGSYDGYAGSDYPPYTPYPDLGATVDQPVVSTDGSVHDHSLVDGSVAGDQLATGDQLTAATDLQPVMLDLTTVTDGAGSQWYQVNQASCPTYCSGIGKTNGAEPEGAHCMSGEVRSASGIAQGINFTWGCWPSCAPQGLHKAQSQGGYCYKPKQKKDNDPTDRTVGCYCN